MQGRNFNKGNGVGQGLLLKGPKATTRFGLGTIRSNTVALMGKDERILIPKLPMALLRSGKPDPAGYVIEVILEPA